MAEMSAERKALEIAMKALTAILDVRGGETVDQNAAMRGHATHAVAHIRDLVPDAGEPAP